MPQTRTVMANAQMITNVLTVSLMRIVLELMKCAMQPTQTATTAKETAVTQVNQTEHISKCLSDSGVAFVLYNIN